MGTDLHLEHVGAAAALRSGPIDRRNAVVVSQRSGHQGVVPDSRAHDQERPRVHQLPVRSLDGGGGTVRKAGTPRVNECHLGVQPPGKG